MTSLQVRNLPAELHERLRRYSREHHLTIHDIALKALEREMERREWHERLEQERRQRSE